MHTHTYATQITHTDLGEERRVGSFRGFGTSLGEHRQTIRVLAPVPLIQEGSSLPPSHSCSSASQTFQGRKDPVGQVAGLDSILHTPRLSLSFSSVEWGSLLWCDGVIDDTHKVLPLIRTITTCCMGKLRHRESTRLRELFLLSFTETSVLHSPGWL